MPLEKNDSSTSTRIKTVAVKKRAAAEPKKESVTKAAKPAKRTKLAVRVLAGELVVGKKEEIDAQPEEAEEGVFTTSAKDLKKKVKKEKISRERETEEANETEERDFFQKINKQIEDDEVDKEEKVPSQSRPVGFYRKISLVFILLTLVLVAAAFYFFLMKLTVEVTPKQERISDKITVTVSSDKPAEGINLSGEKAIIGTVEQIPVKEEKFFQATGANILGQEITGKVSIINNYNQSKTLIATTRLLSPDGKLFRIKDKVDIPAGGSKEVEIYTDEPSQDMAIGPTEFTIPGLWAGLQDKIYAKSSEAFVYQTQVEKFVQAIDIEKAAQDLKESLVKKVSDQFGDNYKGFDKVVAEIDKDSLQSSSTAVANDKTDQFTVSLSAMVNVVAFNSADAEKMAEEKLLSIVSSDKKILGLDKSKTEYGLSGTDFANKKATLEVSFVGTAMLSQADNVIKKEKLVGLSEAQINNYLRDLDKFSNFKLVFQPSFIKKAPMLVDRIKVIIKQ
jgi:hypothetical protein